MPSNNYDIKGRKKEFLFYSRNYFIKILTWRLNSMNTKKEKRIRNE